MAAALAFVAACGAVLKPPAPDRRLDIKQSGGIFDSSNGYRIAVLPELGAKVIRLDVRYPVGSADDPPGKEGLAHLVEHLLFDVEYSRGGTKTSISAELGRVALSWNAETHEDYTAYQTVLLRKSVDDVIELEVNRLAIGCAGLTPEIFAREREVVVNEMRQRQGASGAQLQRVIHEAIYPPGHPYRAVDSADSVAHLELADACAFIATKYQQGRAFVIASGDVDEDLIEHAAAKKFPRLRTRTLAAKATPPAVDPPPGTVRLQADIDEPGALIATWALPPLGATEYRLLETVWPSMARELEQFGFMFKWGHDGFATVLGGAYAPVLAVGIYLNSIGDADEAKSFVGKAQDWALTSLGQNRDDDGWRIRWQSRIERLLAQWESLDGRNALAGDFLMFDKNQAFLVGHVAEIKDSSPSQVRDLVHRWLSPSRARYLVIEPSGTMPMKSSSTYQGGSEAHVTQVDGTLADQPLPAPPARTPLSVESYTLGNGLTVWLWPYGSSPVVRGRLVVDSGSAHDPQGKEGVSWLLGAGDIEPDSIVFADRELAMLVDDLVRTLGLELRSPGLPLSDDAKEYLKARLHKRSTFERTVYDRRMFAAVYGDDHPYARPSITEQTMGGIHHDLVRDWARSHVVAKNTTLIITGHFDPELVKKHIAYNLDQVRAGSDSEDIVAPRPSSVPRYVEGTASKPSPTLELDVYIRSAPGIDADHAKRLVLEQLLDAELSKLRDKQALTYGFYAGYSPRKAGGLWMISGQADARRAAEAASSLLAILDDMRRDPETYRASFVLARQKVLERLLVSATDSYSVAENLAFEARFDLDPAYLDGLPAKVAQLTLQDFHPFVVKELPAARQVFGAFGNVGPAKAAVAAAKDFKARP